VGKTQNPRQAKNPDLSLRIGVVYLEFGVLRFRGWARINSLPR
jgi:hypothetical protein